MLPVGGTIWKYAGGRLEDGGIKATIAFIMESTILLVLSLFVGLVERYYY